MNINIEEKDNEIIVKLDGRLDKLSSPELDAELQPIMEKDKNIVFDLKNLIYISSAGLRILLATKKTMKAKGKDISIINIVDDVKDILVVSGFIQLLGLLQ